MFFSQLQYKNICCVSVQYSLVCTVYEHTDFFFHQIACTCWTVQWLEHCWRWLIWRQRCPLPSACCTLPTRSAQRDRQGSCCCVYQWQTMPCRDRRQLKRCRGRGRKTFTENFKKHWAQWEHQEHHEDGIDSCHWGLYSLGTENCQLLHWSFQLQVALGNKW